MIHPYYWRYPVPSNPLLWLAWFQKPTLTERNVYTPTVIILQYGRKETDKVRAEGRYDNPLD